MKFNQQLRKAEGTKIPKVELTISIDGVAIQEPKTKVNINNNNNNKIFCLFLLGGNPPLPHFPLRRRGRSKIFADDLFFICEKFSWKGKQNKTKKSIFDSLSIVL